MTTITKCLLTKSSKYTRQTDRQTRYL